MAEIDAGGLHFVNTMDNDKLNGAIEETLRRIKGLSDGTVAGGKNMDAAFNATADLIKNKLGEIDSAIDLHNAELQKLEAEYKQLGIDASIALNAGRDSEYNAIKNQQNLLQGEISLRKKLVQTLEESANALDEQAEKNEKARQKSQQNENAQKSMRSRIKELREEMMLLIDQGIDEGSEAYRKLSDELGRLTDIQGDVAQQAKQLANDEQMFQGVIQGLSGVAGGFSAVTGAISLFGSENEELQKVMTKVQSVMAITIGLQQVAQTLNKDSAFQLVTLRKAKELFAVATNKVSVALGVSNVAAKALMATLTLGLSAAITGIIYLVDKYISKNNEAKKAIEEQLKAEKEAAAARSNEIASSYAKEQARIEALRAALNSDNVSRTKKLELIKQLKKEIPNYTAELDKEGRVIKENTAAITAYMDELERSIKFRVYEKDLENIYTKIYEREKYNAKKEAEDIRKIYREAGKEYDEFGVPINAKRVGADNAMGIDLQIDYSHLDPELQKLKEEAEEIKALIASGFTPLNTNSNSTSGTGASNSFDTEINKIKTAYTQYFNWLNAGLKDEADKEFAILLQQGANYKEFLENKLKETGLNNEQIKKLTDELANETETKILASYQKQLQDEMKAQSSIMGMIETLAKAREELGNDTSGLTNQKTNIIIEQERQLGEQLKQETSRVVKENEGINDKLIDLRIDYYNELALLNRQRENTISIEEAQRLDRAIANRNKKYNEDAQNLLNVYTDAHIRKINLNRDKMLFEQSRKRYLFETERESEMLRLQKEAAEETLEQLKKLYKEAPTDALAEEIEYITLEIQKMNAELGKMPNKKFGEMLSGLQKITSALGGLEGEIGEIFSGISSQLDNIRIAFDKNADTFDKVSSGISGIVSVINMVTSASKERKRVEKEFYENQIALAHEYALAINNILLTQSAMSENGFVVDYTERIKDSMNALSDATTNYYNSLEKLADGKAKIDLRNAVDWGNVGTGLAGGAAAGAAIGSVIPVIGTAIGAVAGALIGGIVGLFGGKKKKDVYGGLLDVLPELVDSTGNLNKELATSLLSTNQLDDATKQLVQNAIDWEDAIKQANDQFKEITTDLAGDLGNGIKNALVESFRAGEDASQRMFDAASKSMENFIESLLFSALFSDHFDKFASDLAKSFAPGGDWDIVDDYDRLMEAIDGLDNVFAASLKSVKQRSEKLGFNMYGDTQNTSLTGAIKGVTEETASIVAGQMNAIRINQMNSTDILRNSLIQLTMIAKNTSYNHYLQSIDTKLAQLQNSGDSLRSHGNVNF